MKTFVPVFFIKRTLFLIDFGDGQQHAVVKAIKQVIKGQPMPGTHHQHIEQEGPAGPGQTAFEPFPLDASHEKAGKEVITEPM